MKTKTQPIILKSGSNLEQACYEGMNTEQLKIAKEKVKWFESLGVMVPYGMIRKYVLKNNSIK